MRNDRESLFRTWGNYYDYPACCINAFIEGRHHIEARNEIFSGSGFVPCSACDSKLEGKTLEEAILWLGRDPFGGNSLEAFLKETYTEKFIAMANIYGLDVDSYRKAIWNR